MTDSHLKFFTEIINDTNCLSIILKQITHGITIAVGGILEDINNHCVADTFEHTRFNFQLINSNYAIHVVQRSNAIEELINKSRTTCANILHLDQIGRRKNLQI